MEEKKNSKKTLVIVLIAVLVLALGAFVGARLLGGPKEPQPVPDPDPASVEVESVSFGAASYTVQVGKQKPTSVLIQPQDAAEPGLTYQSADPSVVKVDENGVLTGVAEGSTSVTVTSKNGKTAKVPVEVATTIWIEMPQDSYAWNKKAAGKDYSDGWLCEPVLDPDIADWKVTFETGDSKVAKVDENGNVVCYQLGSTTLTATASDGNRYYTASMPIYVNGYVLDIEGADQSHQGGGHGTPPTYFYGCTCETTGDANFVRYHGKITKYYNGKVTKYDIYDKGAPALKVANGSDYFEASSKGFVRIRSKAKTMTETKKLTVSFVAEDANGLQTLGDNTGFDCVLEPTGFTAVSKDSNVHELMYMFQDEYNVFVVSNEKKTVVNFNMNVADVELSSPARTDEISSLSCSGKSISFVPHKASGSPLETDVVAYTAGGQKVKLHVFWANLGSPVTFAGGSSVTLTEGKTASLAPGIDKAVADAYGGVSVSYSVSDSSIASVSSDGTVSFVYPGSCDVTVKAKYGDSSESRTYKVYCDGYKLSLSIASNYIWFDPSSRLNFTISLVEVKNGVGTGLGTVKPSGLAVGDNPKNYIHHKDGYIYVLEDPGDYVTEKCRFRCASPDGKDLYTEYFNVKIEPLMGRPSCNANVGFSDIFHVYDTSQRVEVKYFHIRIKSVEVVQGFDALSNLTYDESTIGFNVADFFTEPNLRIALRITSVGGQQYVAVFGPGI